MNKPSDHHGIRYGLAGELPESYNDPVLHAMPCNPHQLFVYWELPRDAVDTDSRLLLRLFENGPREAEVTETSTETEIAPDSRGVYIDVPFPGLSYTIELVKIRPDDSRQRLLHAHQIVPPAVPDCPAALAHRQSPDASGVDSDGPSHPSDRRHGKKTRNELEPSPYFNSRPTGHSSWSLPGSGSLAP